MVKYHRPTVKKEEEGGLGDMQSLSQNVSALETKVKSGKRVQFQTSVLFDYIYLFMYLFIFK